MHRRTLAVLSGVAAASVAVTAWAVVPDTGHTVTAPEIRVVRFYENGPASSCNGDACGVGLADPTAFELPGSKYSGTITISLGFTTTGDGRFTLRPRITTAGTTDDQGTVRPVSRLLPPVPHTTATTVVYRVTGIPGDTPLELGLSIGIGRRESTRTSIRTHNVLVELRASKPH